MGLRGWLGRRFAAPPAQVTVEAGPGQGLILGNAFSSADYTDGSNELPVQEAVRDSVSPGEVFYDVGANVGFFGLIAARVVGDAGVVYAFEPIPHIAAQARANAESNNLTNLEVLEVAVSDRDDSAPLIVTTHPGGATLSGADAGDDALHEVEVRTVRLDTLVEAGTIRPPNAVKIDVEGVEVEVLEGLRTTLARYRPRVICELDAATRERLAEKIEGTNAVFRDLGYATRELPPSYEGSGWQVVHLLATPG